jgi:hypothetical protein
MSASSHSFLLSPLWCLILALVLQLIAFLLRYMHGGGVMLGRSVYSVERDRGRSCINDCASQRGGKQLIFSALQLCFTPCGTITRSPASMFFSSPPTTAFAVPAVKNRCWSTWCVCWFQSRHSICIKGQTYLFAYVSAGRDIHQDQLTAASCPHNPSEHLDFGRLSGYVPDMHHLVRWRLLWCTARWEWPTGCRDTGTGRRGC